MTPELNEPPNPYIEPTHSDLQSCQSVHINQCVSSTVPMHSPTCLSAPIGVYDSGVGGVSVLKALRAKLPNESFLYVADSGHAPYGDRDSDFVEARAVEITRYLHDRGAKAIVLACNTASVVAVNRLRSMHSLPIIAMEPAIKPAVELTRSKVVVVLATSRTVQSAAVERLCRLFGSGVKIILQPCPGLVEQVEGGVADNAITLALLEKYLRPALDAGADTIVLGCTHYPFLDAQIRQIAGPDVLIVEPSEAIANQLARRLQSAANNRTDATNPGVTFLTSGCVAAMKSFLTVMWGADTDVGSLHLIPPRNEA